MQWAPEGPTLSCELSAQRSRHRPIPNCASSRVFLPHSLLFPRTSLNIHLLSNPSGSPHHWDAGKFEFSTSNTHGPFLLHGNPRAPDRFHTSHRINVAPPKSTRWDLPRSNHSTPAEQAHSQAPSRGSGQGPGRDPLVAGLPGESPGRPPGASSHSPFIPKCLQRENVSISL